MSNPAPTLFRCSGVILAAGEARRMGQPKQLLLVHGQPLVVRAVEAMLASSLWPVVVVIGAHAEPIRAALARYPVILAENSAWPEGMASSLRVGVETVERFSSALDAALFAVCDQPGFDAAAVASLLARFADTRELTAARYANRCGVPALFPQRYFAELRALTGPEGAKPLLSRYADRVQPVDLPRLAIDLDTPAEYQDFLAARK